MKRVRSKNTAPEMAIRKRLFAAGIRYRVHYRPKGLGLGRSTIDIAFPRLKIAIFIDGCFWHGCEKHGTTPKANHDWWAQKLQSNRERDNRIRRALGEAGWTVLSFWTHEPAEEISTRILAVVNRGSLPSAVVNVDPTN
jgi:DNA mismatch endonuclease (patch repair protein)